MDIRGLAMCAVGGVSVLFLHIAEGRISEYQQDLGRKREVIEQLSKRLEEANQNTTEADNALTDCQGTVDTMERTMLMNSR